MRNLLRVLGVATAIIGCLFAGVSVVHEQEDFPPGTNFNFGLITEGAQLEKTTIVSHISELAVRLGTPIFKNAPSFIDGDANVDVIYFPASGIQLQGRVPWLSAVDGQYVAPEDIGTRTLTGSYAIQSAGGQERIIRDWAEETGLELTGFDRLSPVHTSSQLVRSGIGYALGTLILLALSSCLFIFARRRTARKVLLTSGVARWRIHYHDVWEVWRTFSFAALFTYALIVLACLVWGWTRTDPFVWRSFTQLLALLAICLVVTVAASRLALPRIRDAGIRTTVPDRRLNLGAGVARALGLVLIVFMLPLSSYSATLAHANEEQLQQWTRAQDAVRLQISASIDSSAAQEAYISAASEFLSTSAQENLPAFSAVIDQLMDIPVPDGYDHIILADRNYINLMGITVSDLALVNVDSSTRDALSTLATNGAGISAHYYSWNNEDAFPAIGPSLLDASNTVKTSNPLIVVLENPYQELDQLGALGSFLVNGQVIFSNPDKVLELATKSGFSSFILGVDNVTDAFAAEAQFQRILKISGVLATFIAAATVGLMLFVAALNWGNSNPEQIFALYTAGSPRHHIVRTRIRKEFALAVIACAIGATLAVMQLDNLLYAGTIVALVLLVYMGGTYWTHLHVVRAISLKTIHRT